MTSFVGTRVRFGVMLAIMLLAAGCAASRARRSAPPSAVTVEQLVSMAGAGTPPAEMHGAVQRSGTIFRLRPEDADRLKTAGVPKAMVSYLQLSYEAAVRARPSLANSDDDWHEVGGYWYGGTPFGWPQSWVAPPPAAK